MSLNNNKERNYTFEKYEAKIEEKRRRKRENNRRRRDRARHFSIVMKFCLRDSGHRENIEETKRQDRANTQKTNEK